MDRRKKRREGRRGEVREDGGADMAAGATSADADRPSLNSAGFYWLTPNAEWHPNPGVTQRKGRNRTTAVNKPFNHTTYSILP